MDNVSGNPNHGENPNESIPLSNGAAEPARPAASPASASPGVSRAPLNLGGGAAAPVAPAAPKAPVVRPVPPKPPTSSGVASAAVGVASACRITACKTFFTKMHPGAIHFLDEMITKWLSENPQVVIKHTNVLQGEITEKKIEQNIVIVVWY
ncbi:MAG: hypothetical protein M1376_19095 [Planctomycetes bacterium]|nr:hypothetical protein [Planctomycetota bacterium]